MKLSSFFLFVAMSFASSGGFTQINKADFDNAIAKFGVSKFEHIFVFNQRTFNTDGSSGLSYSEYGGEQTGYELSSTSISLFYYSDNSKAKLNGVTVIPFSSIKFFVMGKELSIHLNE